ncbi:MAG TPA: YHS domain-containing (seleno)protein [Limnobacter sp.]|nr:YHS domain-containing (seleno)protein [Limnobacter sp.]
MTFIASTRRWTLLAFAALALSGCGAMTAQNPSAGLSPVNAIAMDQSDRVMLFGADVVAYFTQNQYVQGQADIRSTYKDVDFYFSNPAHKALFDAEPEKYLPQYGGYCANGIMFGIPWGGNAQDFSVVDGKLYIFGGDVSKAAFELKLQESIQLADTYWQQEVANSNSFIQRTKRLVMRVPHYKTGEEQAAEVQAAKSGS